MLYRGEGARYLAKIAVDCESKGPARRVLASGDGWSVSDVICGAGPSDRPFEEQFSNVSIAIVLTGSFSYRSTAGRELMTPGSLLLGNAGQYFECGHEHAVGDRCVSFTFDQRYFEDLAAEAGVPSARTPFSRLRVPPVRQLSSLVSRARAGLEEVGDSWCPVSMRWEEIGVALATQALTVATSPTSERPSLPAAEARVTRIVRMIEKCPDANHGLAVLARQAKLSRYQFLRVFHQVTGVTPHQYVRRARLRLAATQLMVEPHRILDIALDSGFGDVSNFNHAFRAEFGVSPRFFRSGARR
jgi:AraC family transcriptional regulator